MSENHRKLVIVGSGPSGLTAAIYASRANLEPLVIEGAPSSTGDQPGGQLMLTTDVENFPGFPNGIQGPELMASFRKQAERFGSEFITDRVTKLDLSARPFRVWVGSTDGNPTYTADAVILSTGAKALMLNLDREVELIGRGISTCATCDGFFFRDQEIAVVGGGDSAVEEALFLTKFASKVTLIHRRDQLRASKIMQDRAFANPKIEYCWDSVVTGYLGDQALTGITVENVNTAEQSSIDVTGLFIAIGHKPNSELIVDSLDTDSDGYVLTGATSTATSIGGVFACGDVQDKRYRQAITAAGSGASAAIDAERFLESNQ